MSETKDLLEGLCYYKTRSEARKALSAMGPDNVGKDLIEFVKDNRGGENAVWAVIDIFSTWSWDGAKETLVDLLEIRPNLQGDILRTLRKITGSNHGYNIDLWRMELQAGPFAKLHSSFFSGEILSFDLKGDYCRLKIPVGQERKQQVTFELNGRIYTVCGTITEEQMSIVEDYNNNHPNEKLNTEKVDDGYLVSLSLQYDINRPDVDYDDLKRTIIHFAEVADHFEEQLTGKDVI